MAKGQKSLIGLKLVFLFRFLGGLCWSYIGLAANCRHLLDEMYIAIAFALLKV